MQYLSQMEVAGAAIESLKYDDLWLTIEWRNGGHARYPLIFLMDNAPGTRHANGQKLIETAALDIACGVDNIWLNENGAVCVRWKGQPDEQVFPIDWFLSAPAGAVPSEILWDSQLYPGLPEGDFDGVSGDERLLAEWLDNIVKYGFALLRNVPPSAGMLLEVVKLFGYIRETNYGKIFDVKTVIRPNNLAFTGLKISAHTDNPYRNPTPTLQLLHCLSSDSDGGDSLLADGFRIAQDLRRDYPDYFNILSTTMVSFTFRDEENWLERSTPIISLYPDGTVSAIRMNNRSIQPVRLPPDELLMFYKAYLQFARMTNDERYQVQFKMSPGDLYIVDNERILHARGAYDNKGGERWLQGGYADRDGLLSKWRVLRGRYLAGSASPVATVDRLFDLYKAHGDREYGERVTMLMHMMQAALLAESEGAGDELVVAAFLHDIGHFLEGEEQMGIYGTKAHDRLGEEYLLDGGFPERMARLVSSHVAAKRYLTAVDKTYLETLSDASKETLSYQGGPMTAEEAARFEQDGDYADYIRIRIWDDKAKEVGIAVREEDLARMREKVYGYLLRSRMV